MKTINRFLSLLIFSVGFASCDYLDRDPIHEIDKNNFFASANGDALEQYCNELYPKLIIGHGNSGNYSFGMLAEDFKSDNILPWQYDRISFGHHTLPLRKNDTPWDWAVIRSCNTFLIEYEKSPASEGIRNKYAGEIIFFKVMDYFNKVKTYGDVPWYETPLSQTDTEELYKGRDSRVLVMKNMITQLDKAIEWLPTKEETNKVYRISKDAAIALKARICLHEGTFRRYHNIEGDKEYLEMAYEAAGRLMSGEFNYSLFNGSGAHAKPSKAYYDLFIQPDYNTNPEIILSREYEPAVGGGNNLTRQIVVGEDPIGMSKSAADDYLCANTGLPIHMCDCHKGDISFIEELRDRDPRLLQTVPTPEPGEFTYYLNGKRPAIGKVVSGNNGATSTGYAIIKFYRPEDYTPAHHQGTLDAPIMRYAEILLIRAEAGAELGKDPELDKTINALRDRVGFTHHLTANPIEDPVLVEKYPGIKGANANLIREIRRERNIELFGEGYRYDDLMRWAAGHNLAKVRTGFKPNKQLNADDQTGYTQAELDQIEKDMGFEVNGCINIYGKRVQRAPIFETPKNYYFGVPLNELSLNPNLKPQNPGWE